MGTSLNTTVQDKNIKWFIINIDALGLKLTLFQSLLKYNKTLFLYFQVVKMLVIVVAMFGICWLPLHLFTLILDFYPNILKTVSMETLTRLFISSHWLAMSNSFANPIIYGFTNESFRVCINLLIRLHYFNSTEVSSL